jgi:hypothetical protein
MFGTKPALRNPDSGQRFADPVQPLANSGQRLTNPIQRWADSGLRMAGLVSLLAGCRQPIADSSWQ